jgi:hypothetical protein
MTAGCLCKDWRHGGPFSSNRMGILGASNPVRQLPHWLSHDVLTGHGYRGVLLFVLWYALKPCGSYYSELSYKHHRWGCIYTPMKLVNLAPSMELHRSILLQMEQVHDSM